MGGMAGGDTVIKATTGGWATQAPAGLLLAMPLELTALLCMACFSALHTSKANMPQDLQESMSLCLF